MTKRTKPLLTSSLLLLLLSPGARAQGGTLEDTGFWFMLFSEGPLWSDKQGKHRLRWWFDLQPRFLDDVSGIHQLLVRPGVGYVLDETTSAWLGYARVRTTQDVGAESHEDRIWQQFLWKPRIEQVSLQSRTRLEQRFLDTGSDTGWRLRQFVKAGWALPPAPRFSLVGYDEVFVDLNDTDWGQNTGFAQNRFFAGIGFQLDAERRGVVELGYLNQFINGGAANTMNHILSLNLLLSL